MLGRATLTIVVSSWAMKMISPATTTRTQSLVSRAADRSTGTPLPVYSRNYTSRILKERAMPGTPEALNARSRRTRELLLAAARTLLEEEGFDALTMTAVAERSGV